MSNVARTIAANNNVFELFTQLSNESFDVISTYATRWGAQVQVASTPANDEHIVAVMHDDHVFAAASSKVSQLDALRRLASRIRAKAV